MAGPGYIIAACKRYAVFPPIGSDTEKEGRRKKKGN